MKKMLLLFILSLFLMTTVQAQWQFIHLDFNVSMRPCMTDSTLIINQYTNWDMYKTLNNEWNGPLDSTFCGELDSLNMFNFNTLNTGETIFLRYRFNDNNKELLYENMLYAATFDVYNIDPNLLELGTNCANNLCSGVIVGVEIPDSAGTGKDMRWYESPLSNSVSLQPLVNSFCVATEYFSQNYLREAIIKLTIDNPTGSWIPNALTLETIDFGANYISDSIFITKIGGQYIKDVYYDHTLVIKSDTSLYPNGYGIEYVDLKPIPNVDTAVTMNIVISQDASLIFQPFVEFQGGYLLNDTTQRHHYNIVNNGGNICFPNYIEVRFSNGNNYVHHSGTVDFGGKMACMQFGESSKLIIEDNAKFVYGSNGMGNLALRSRSSIEIGKNAELVINNNVLLHEFRYDTEPQQIYMTLNEGSKLTFGKNARIYNGYSLGRQMKLNIYMKGGTVDLSNLDGESYEAVNLIYDEVEPNFVDNIKVLGNPTHDQIRFSIVTENDDKLTYHLVTLDGKQAQSANFFTQKGINYIEIPVAELANGIYILNIQSGENTFVEKIIVAK